jgi:hypothetical protein
MERTALRLRRGYTAQFYILRSISVAASSRGFAAQSNFKLGGGGQRRGVIVGDVCSV